MLVLGIETSCDETGLAVYDTRRGLLAHALHSQVAMHAIYGGVVPELASRDHVRRVVPLAQRVLAEAGVELADLDGIAYTRGPGLAGALLVGASVASALGYALGKPGHRRPSHGRPSAVAAARDPKPAFPFVALLVSGGHTPAVRSRRASAATGCSATPRTMRPAKPSTRRRSSWASAIPADPRSRGWPRQGREGAVSLPRPMLDSGDLDMSFCGLKTAVLTLVRREAARGALDDARRADIAREFQHAVVDVLVAKAVAALDATGSHAAGGRGRRGRQSRIAGAARDGARQRVAGRCIFPDSSSAPTTAR